MLAPKLDSAEITRRTASALIRVMTPGTGAEARASGRRWSGLRAAMRAAIKLNEAIAMNLQ